jgi:hypothetical protein
VIAVTLLALLLVAAVPVALLAGVVLMMLGHVAGGLALSGGSILAAVMAVAVAGMSGMRHLRKLLPGRRFGVVQLDASQYTGVAEPGGSDYASVVRLDRSEYPVGPPIVLWPDRGGSSCSVPGWIGRPGLVWH